MISRRQGDEGIQSKTNMLAFFDVQHKIGPVRPNIEDRSSVDFGFFRAVVIDPNPPATPKSSSTIRLL